MKVIDAKSRNLPLTLACLNELSQNAKQRRLESDGGFATAMGGADIHFMTPAERDLRHQLMLLLPTQGEEREAAKARIAERIATRKQGRSVSQVDSTTQQPLDRTQPTG